MASVDQSIAELHFKQRMRLLMMKKGSLMVIVLAGLFTLAGCKDRVIWDDNGKVESATKDREVWDSNGKMNTGDRKIWVDQDGKEVIK